MKVVLITLAAVIALAVAVGATMLLAYAPLSQIEVEY